MKALRFVWHYLKSLGLSFYEIIRGTYSYTASALAFLSLFGFISVLAISIYVFSFFPLFLDSIKLVQDYMLNNLLPESIQSLNKQMQMFIVNAAQLSFISIIFLFISGLTLIITLRSALNDIWQKSTTVTKKSISTILYWSVLLLVAIVFSINVIVGTYILSTSWLSLFIQNHGLGKMAISIFSMLINTLMFSFAYIYIPNYKISHKSGFIGGVAAALLFEIAKTAFSYYIRNFSSYGLIYGAFAIIPIFLFWVYISWLIVLFGAVFAFISGKRLEGEDEK